MKKIFREKASGGRWDRPELLKMIDQLREGDTVIVWKLDRLSRSLHDLLKVMKELDDKGVGFVSVTDPVDTTTPAGRMMMQMIGAFAEFERAVLRERTASRTRCRPQTGKSWRASQAVDPGAGEGGGEDGRIREIKERGGEVVLGSSFNHKQADVTSEEAFWSSTLSQVGEEGRDHQAGSSSRVPSFVRRSHVK